MTTYYLLLEDGFGQLTRREIFQKYWIEEFFILLLWTFISSQRDTVYVLKLAFKKLSLDFPVTIRTSDHKRKATIHKLFYFKSNHQA